MSAPASPIIYLHIGRNKAGSTTLQDFFLQNRAELEQRGIRYALFGHLKDSEPGVLGFAHQLELKDYAHAHPDKHILISNEFMFHWPPINTNYVVEALRGLQVKIIAYIRPYPAWVCSSYAQDIRSGESRDDFDAYFESLRPRFSVWPCLRPWGEQLGWNNITVRLIDKRNTSWDNLIGDCLTAIGLEPNFGHSVAMSNQGPHWMITELLRALAGLEAGPAATEELQKRLQKCLDADPHSRSNVQYLTQAQGAALEEIYDEDIANINAFTGAGLIPEPLIALPERPFLPAFSHLPPVILRSFAARISNRAFAMAHPEAAAAGNSLFKKGLLPKPGIAAAIQRAFMRR